MRDFESTPPDVRALLPQRISALGLKLEGSPVERYVRRLYRELERKALAHFRPPCYLTDEWGCPSGEPIIGIPFYLADPKLARLEKEIDDLEDEREIGMYLRHEAGHAFNYAYRLYDTPEWRDLFGPFNRPYRDRYRPVPFDRTFVRHLEGWYAQKHPDEDFAETFAVWLTPRSRWRGRYRGWPAMRKLRYVDRVARRVKDTEPSVRLASTDITVEEMDKIEYWTGVRRSVVRALVERIEETAARLQLQANTRAESTTLVELTAYATTLAMNFLTLGRFVPKGRRPPGRGATRPAGPARSCHG